MTPQTTSEALSEDPELAALEDIEPPDLEEDDDDDDDPEDEDEEPVPASVPVAVPDPDAKKPPLQDLEALRAAIGRQKNPQVATRVVGDSPYSQNPAYRPTVSGDEPASQGFDHAAFQDDLSDGKVRNFDDIFSRFQFSEGEYIVYVDRKSPMIFRGSKIGGMQKAITYPMDHQTFAKTYGSGSYTLTVYGPAPGKQIDSEGNVRRKAYTKPIKVEVPDPFKQNPPVLEMAEVGVEEDQEMPIYSMRRGGATEADAEIEKTRMETELESEERKFNREERLRERQEAKERQKIEDEREKHRQSSSIVERMLEQQAEELREHRNKGTTEIGSIAEVLKALRPESNASESQRLQADLAEERRRNESELNRIREAHQREIERLRDDHTQHSREERANAQRDAQLREDALRKQVEDARNDTTRRLEELRVQYEARLSDERRQHDRDLANSNQMNNSATQTIGSSFEMRLEVKTNEITRLSNELAQVRHELEAEKKKTLADRVEEFTSSAEALGFSKDDGGDKNWKDMLGEAAIGLIQQAPTLAASVVSTLRQQQAPQLPAPRQQPMLSGGGGYPDFVPFATDGVDTDMRGYQNQGPVVYPGDEYEDEYEDDPPQAPATAPAPVRTQAPPAQQKAPEQKEALVKTPQAEPVFANNMNISDEQIIEFSEMFRSALSQGASPEEFSDGILQQLGPMMTGSIVREIPVERVTTVLQGTPGGDKDPLVRRDGQKFLKNVWEIIKKKTPQ